MSCGSEKADRRKIEFIHHCVGREGIRKHELCHTSRRPDEIPSEAADSLAILASTAGARHRTRPAPLPPRSKASKLRFHNNRHSRQRSRVHSLALACTSFLRHRHHQSLLAIIINVGKIKLAITNSLPCVATPIPPIGHIFGVWGVEM